MNELQMLVKAFEENQQSGKTSLLATVVKVKGSAYRRPGARMLITQEGQIIGTVSGGCLENDVKERAGQVTSGEPIVVKYDTTSEDDIVWGLGLGCNGVVEVLIERLNADCIASGLQESEPSHLAFLAECLRYQQQGVLVTVFGVEGQVQVKIGDRLMLYPNDTAIGKIGDCNLTSAIIDDAKVALREGQSKVETYQLAAGSAEVFIEVIQPPTPLVIFGAGHDAIPVARLAKELGWHVTIVDNRQSHTTLDRFYMADDLILTGLEAVKERVYMDSRTVAVIMTHNYLHDRELLKMLLPSPVRYLGVLGSKSRTERLLQDLFAEKMVYTEEQLRRLYSPVGIDIGADTPEEIALAIVAEIRAVLANRSGGSLRDRRGPIHKRSALN